MKGDKNARNTVWLYAIILFTSAFVILLITAFSQIKLSNNLDEYKDQLSTEENEKNNIQVNLGTALNDNKKLVEELNAIKKEKEKLKKQVETGNEALVKEQQKATASLNAHDMLINAQVEFDSGNILKCAEILYGKIDTKLLSNTGVALYEDLVNKTYGRAAEILYVDGHNNYMNEKYEDAIKVLEKSFSYTTDMYFSDDCLYFIAYSYYRIGNSSETKAYMQKLVEMYSNSSYKKEAISMIKGT